MGATLETPAVVRRQDIVPGAQTAAISGSEAGQLPFAPAIFLSAFLLFQVQLLLGKELLPLFGGAPAVWTACVLVFQLLFLAGYGYSHGLAARLPIRKQVLVHNILLGVSAVYLLVLASMQSTPISVGSSLRSHSGNPAWTIMELLIRAIGLPFFLLSATSPLMQHWFSRSAPKKSPYRLYALSNVGSLLGLLSYPLWVEPHLGLRVQGWSWTAGYGLFLVCYFFSARSAASQALPAVRSQPIIPDLRPRGASPSWPLRIFWAGLAACASVLLLATTNLICQDIAVSPFLWVLQLSLYLLSFILCFENDRWYRREIFHPLFVISLGFVILVSLPKADYSFLLQLAAYSAVLFAGCMVCHGEAARTRPRAESLTAFYFSIAAGGAFGGIVVGLVAPSIFPNYWEYPFGVIGCVAVVLFVSERERTSWWHTGRASLALAILSGIVLLAPILLASVWSDAPRLPLRFSLWTAAALAAAAVVAYALERRRTLSAPAAPFFIRSTSRIALALLIFGLLIPQKAALYHVIASSRDFYGVLSVVNVSSENYQALRHGNIVHGFQYQDKQRAHVANGYYGSGSGVNIVIRNWPRHPMRVGLVGMGTGTLAALGQPGDVFRFFEIDPDVYKLSSGSQPYFTYLKDSSARIEVVLGDARLSLEQEAARGDLQKFDVLVLDAFSSDAIPMHLLTREAFSIYQQHLRGPASVIAVHISNRTLDLGPVLAGIARDFGLHALRVYTLLPTGPFSASDWILFSRDPASLAGEELVQHGEPFPAQTRAISWTDDYCDLFDVVRWR